MRHVTPKHTAPTASAADRCREAASTVPDGRGAGVSASGIISIVLLVSVVLLPVVIDLVLPLATG